MSDIAKKRLLILFAVCSVFVACTAGLFVWRRHRIAAHFQGLRVDGMAAAASNDYPLAVADLREYLGRYDKDADALAAYCRVRPKVPSTDRSHIRETIAALRRYVAMKPDAVEQRRELLTLYLTYNLNAEALGVAERLLTNEPANVDLLAAKTKALARLRRTPDALAAAKQWTAAAPTNVEGQQYRVELLKLSGMDDATILKDIDSLVAADGGSVGLRVARAQALLQAGRYDDARVALRDAALMPSKIPADERALASMMDRAGLFDDSISLLKKLSQSPAADRDANDASLARRLWERGDAAGFLNLVADRPSVLDDPELLGMRALFLHATGDASRATEDLAKLRGQKSDPVAKAWTAIVENSDGTLTVVQAKAQIDFISDALIDRPNDAYLQNYLGETYAQAGDLELALSLYERASQNAPAWSIPLMRTSNVLVTQGRYDEAYKSAAMAAARSQPIALANLIQVWTSAVDANQRDDAPALLKLIDEVIAQAKEKGWLEVARATVLSHLGRTDEATQTIAAILKDDVASLDQSTLLRLFALTRTYKLNVDEGTQRRLQAGTGVPANSAAGSFAQAVRSEGNDAAIASFEKQRALAADGQSREWMLADAKIRDLAGDAGAPGSWKTLLAKYGDDLQVIQSAMLSSSVWNDREMVDGLIDDLRTLSGDRGLAWRLNRARWLIEGSTDQSPDLAATQRASDLLTELLAKSPDNVAARFWQARCQSRLGNPGAAIESLSKAGRIAPRSASIALFAAQLLQEQGDFAHARELLDRLSPEDLADAKQAAFAASLLAGQGRGQEAITLLEQSRSTDVVGSSDLPLAMLYARQGQFVQAEAIIDRLLQHPTLPVVTFAADFYRSRGKADAAAAVLKKLDGLGLKQGVREMTLADYYLRGGDNTQAMQFGEAAVNAAPQNVATWRGLIVAELQSEKFDAATATLDRAITSMPADSYLADLRSATTWPLIAHSRDTLFRPLAIQLAIDPKNEPIRQALTLADGAKGAITPTLVESMKQLASRYPLSLPVQIVAGQLLLDASQNAEAAALTTRAAQSFPTDGALSRLAAQALLKSQQWGQAKAFATTWKHHAGEQDILPADLLAAMASLQLGQPDEAESLLRPHLAEAMSQLDEHGDVVRTLAVSLYRQDKSSDAQQIIEQAISQRSGFAGEWLTMSAEQLPTALAVSWLNKLEPDLADARGKTLAVRVWLQLATRRDAPAEAMSTLQDRLAKLELQSDLSMESLVVIGVVADQIDDDDRAERLYRRAMANGGLPVVWNNLAMILLGQHRQLDEAESLAAKAVAASPETPVFSDTYAQVLLAETKVPAAREAIDRAVRHEPQNAIWKVTAAEIEVAAGQTGKAKAIVDGVLATADARRSLGQDEMRRVELLNSRLVGMSATRSTGK